MTCQAILLYSAHFITTVSIIVATCLNIIFAVLSVIFHDPPVDYGDYHHRCNSVRMCGCLRFGYGGAGLGKSRGEGDEEENTEAW